MLEVYVGISYSSVAISVCMYLLRELYKCILCGEIIETKKISCSEA